MNFINDTSHTNFVKDSDSCGFETDATDARYKKDELLDSFLTAMAVSEGKSVHGLETFEEYSRNNGAYTEMVSPCLIRLLRMPGSNSIDFFMVQVLARVSM